MEPLFASYKENYFVTGIDRVTQVKFQFSTRFNLAPTGSEHSAFIGYTQKAFWDLYSPSSQFRELNYNPEIFYGYFRDLKETLCDCETKLHLLVFRAGAEHESNGLGDAEGKSRSWNRMYVFGTWGFRGESLRVRVSPKLWVPFAVSEENKDITDYLGYGSFTIEVGVWEKTQLGATVVGWKKAGLQSWIMYRPWYSTETSWRLAPSLFLQNYYGYGESLLTFQDRVNAVRVGFAFNDQYSVRHIPESAGDAIPLD